MNSSIRTLFCVAMVLLLQSHTEPVAAQEGSSKRSFQGSWHWENYLSKNDLRKSDIKQLKRWAAGMDIRKTAIESLKVDLTVTEDKLSGTCSSWMRFGDRLDDCEFTARIKGEVAQFTTESSHGAIITVRLKRMGERLSWKIIKSAGEGDYWIPDNVILLRQTKRRAKRMPDNLTWSLQDSVPGLWPSSSLEMSPDLLLDSRDCQGDNPK